MTFTEHERINRHDAFFTNHRILKMEAAIKTLTPSLEDGAEKTIAWAELSASVRVLRDRMDEEKRG